MCHGAVFGCGLRRGNFSFENHYYHIGIKCAQIHWTEHLAEGKSQMLDKMCKFLRSGRRMKLTYAVFSKIERLGMRSKESYSNMIEFLAFCAQKFIFLSLKWIKFLVKTTCERFFFATLIYVDQHVSYTIYFWPEHRTKLTL